MDIPNQSFFERGRVRNALYKKTGIPDYDGNPLIEALPSIMPRDVAAEHLAHVNNFDKSKRNDEDEQRKHYLRTCMEFFTPMDMHLKLEQRFSYALRMGYKNRKPLNPEYWQEINEAILSLNPYDQYDDGSETFHSITSHGFNIVGVSGIGKSQAISRILQIYPQVLNHMRYKERNFTERQLVWLKLDCPHDGNTTALCLNFFQAVDSILNTDYLKKYEGKHPAQLVIGISRVASNHHLGVLVIDEIQRLSLLKSGGHAKMLNFFTQLVNTIRIPVVLVGTIKALPLFTGDFSQSRRGTGQGDVIWKRMKQDEEWEFFVESMRKYEITRRPSTKNELKELSKALYEETQGITDLAVKAFRFAQDLAIDIGAQEIEESGTVKNGEKITAAIIRSAARENFNMLRPALDALKKGDAEGLEIFEDLYSRYLLKYEDEEASNDNEKGSPQNEEEVPQRSERANQNTQVTQLFDQSVNNTNDFFKDHLTKNTPEQAAGQESEKLAPPASKSKAKKSAKSAKDVLSGIFDNSQSRPNGDVYRDLKNADFTISADDPIISGNFGDEKGGF